MALICNRHPFEYAENVCSSCGIAFCHDCLVYPRGPKKPPFCVNCALAEAGVRSSARNPTNLSRREVKKRVREAKGLQPAQPHTEAAPLSNLPSDEHDFELTSSASFDQGWAVSWDEGRDPHPGYPEPVHVNWGSDPTVPAPAPAVEADAAAPAAAPARQSEAPPATPATRPAFVAMPDPAVAPAASVAADEPDEPRAAELPRLKPVELSRSHAPARPGGLPSVRPPIKQLGTDQPRQKLSAGAPPVPKLARPAPTNAATNAPAAPSVAGANAPIPPQQPRVYGGPPATRPDAPAAAAPTTAPPGGRLRRKDDASESTEMLGWLDHLLKTEEESDPRA